MPTTLNRLLKNQKKQKNIKLAMTKNLENTQAESKSEAANKNKIERLIVWFYPVNKKIQKNQFHVEATSMQDALKQLEQCADFNYKVMGVSSYKNNHPEKFVNQKFY